MPLNLISPGSRRRAARVAAPMTIRTSEHLVYRPRTRHPASDLPWPTRGSNVRRSTRTLRDGDVTPSRSPWPPESTTSPCWLQTPLSRLRQFGATTRCALGTCSRRATTCSTASTDRPPCSLGPARRTRLLLVLARRFGSRRSCPRVVAADGRRSPLRPQARRSHRRRTSRRRPASARILGSGAVDQNGVSVDVWAPGLRQACGQFGYENGNDPVPATTTASVPVRDAPGASRS